MELTLGIYYLNYSNVDGALFNKAQNILVKYPNGKAGDYTTPSTVKTIGAHAFSGCINLTTLTITQGATAIFMGAFRNCHKLTTLSIPASLTTVQVSLYDTFENNYKLTQINVDSANTKLKSIDGVLFTTSGTTLSNIIKYPQGKTATTYEIPKTSIMKFAFKGCTALTSVTFQTGFNGNAIGTNAFEDCTGLQSITIPDSVVYI